jgi:tight adherence protein B
VEATVGGALIAGATAAAGTFILLSIVQARSSGEHARLMVLGRQARRQFALPHVRDVWWRLISGDLPLQLIQVAAASTAALFVLGIALRSLTLTLVAAAVAVGGGFVWGQRQKWTLAARVSDQLPPTLSVIADAISAGATLFRALQTAADETSPPLGTMLRSVVTSAELNQPIEEALGTLSRSAGSRDIASVVAALAIHRTTGGDLARLLRELADFLREEQRLRRDARALSAQARYSAQLIGAMPLLLFVVFFAFFPSFIEPLTSTAVGLVVLAYCIVSCALGFFFVWRIASGIARA